MVMVQETSTRIRRATQPLKGASTKTVVEALVQAPIEACSDYVRNDFIGTPGYHAFFYTAERAYTDHRPLILSPDMFWLMIAQGFAQHVNLNAEQMRSLFVEHQGKKTILVRRDDFVKGSPENPWEEAFAAFSDKLQEEIGEENHGNIVVSFSTTGKIEKAANEVVLMEAMKPYFDYRFQTLCGIPEVTLEGEAADWAKLCEKVRQLDQAYKLSDWLSHVHPLLERIARNAEGRSDPDLWSNFYKVDDGSGGPYIQGWICTLIPYIKTYKTNGEVKAPNPCFDWQEERWGGLGNDCLPLGLCQTPFIWEYLGTNIPMEFIAGFVGATQRDNDLALRPKIGWAIRERKEASAEVQDV